MSAVFQRTCHCSDSTNSINMMMMLGGTHCRVSKIFCEMGDVVLVMIVPVVYQTRANSQIASAHAGIFAARIHYMHGSRKYSHHV